MKAPFAMELINNNETVLDTAYCKNYGQCTMRFDLDKYNLRDDLYLRTDNIFTTNDFEYKFDLKQYFINLLTLTPNKTPDRIDRRLLSYAFQDIYLENKKIKNLSGMHSDKWVEKKATFKVYKKATSKEIIIKGHILGNKDLLYPISVNCTINNVKDYSFNIVRDGDFKLLLDINDINMTDIILNIKFDQSYIISPDDNREVSWLLTEVKLND